MCIRDRLSVYPLRQARRWRQWSPSTTGWVSGPLHCWIASSDKQDHNQPGCCKWKLDAPHPNLSFIPLAVSLTIRNYSGSDFSSDPYSGRNQCSSSSIPPVSYTHLRAHETRHDLVCRLLLE